MDVSKAVGVHTSGPLSDWQIRRLCIDAVERVLVPPGVFEERPFPRMIEPFEGRQVSELVEDTSNKYGSGEHRRRVISYGLSSMGYDVRAGTSWKLFVDTFGVLVDPKYPSEEIFQSFELAVGERFILPPNSYALTHSVETFRMPRNVLGICLGKSTYARVGVHVNVTPLEPGWEGQITIEVSNGTRLPVALYAGEGIVQVIFLAGSTPEQTYEQRNGKYQGQVGVTPAIVE